MPEERETRFNVEKAELPMKDGESLNLFQQKLSKAVSSHLKERFALGEKSWIYITDVFGDAVVASVSRSDTPSPSGLYQVSWSRSGDDFKIGDPVEVVRRVTYVPKKQAAVRKSLWSGLL